jgi:hypothetical protein
MVNGNKWYIEVHELMELLESNDLIITEYRDGNVQAIGLLALALMKLKPHEYDEIKKNIDDDEDNISARKDFLQNLKGTINVYKKDSPTSDSFQVLNALIEETMTRLQKLGEDPKAIEIIYTYLSEANNEWRKMNKKISELERK